MKNLEIIDKSEIYYNFLIQKEELDSYGYLIVEDENKQKICFDVDQLGK